MPDTVSFAVACVVAMTQNKLIMSVIRIILAMIFINTHKAKKK